MVGEYSPFDGDREDDLRKAIAMSEEEEAKRRRQLEESNATALFDDNLQL